MPAARPLWDRFWEKVSIGDCWEWTGAKDGCGYGMVNPFESKKRVVGSTRAHRVAWELLVGPMADDLEIDHLCKNRLCINPDHLEPVTHRVNVQRSITGIKRRPKMCGRGLHDMSVHGHVRSNASSTNGHAYCKPCRLESRRARALKNGKWS